MRFIVLLSISVCLSGVEAAELRYSVAPKLSRATDVTYKFDGVIRQRTNAITKDWLLKVPDTNPAILQMFADRDKIPPRDLLPWSGEFAGKFLTGAIQVLRLNNDLELRAKIASFADQLVRLQAEDGYLGPFPQDNHLAGKSGTWDAWGHYHAMLGLLLWYEESGDEVGLRASIKIGDLLCGEFLRSGKRLVDTGNAEMNHAPIHSLCLLYRITGEVRYLELARQIVDEFEDPRAGDYVRTAEAGKEFFEGPKPRWESLHPIQGLAELYWITAEERFRRAFEHHWWSIVKLDRHNNGGFSSGEQAQGNPYHPGAIETCCTVAWIAMSVDMLRMTGNPVIADELELSTLNQVIGYQHPLGKSCTYNTPMDGIRRRSTEEIGFQIRPGSEGINCCSANAPRGFGMVSDWALMTDGAGLVLNWYGPCVMKSRIGDLGITLAQQTNYPREGAIHLTVTPDHAAVFPLRLRIPHWSAKSTVMVNGETMGQAAPGTYVSLVREWKQGDLVTISLDVSLHYWKGERECSRNTSLYWGSLLLVHESKAASALPIRFSPEWKNFGNLNAADTPKAAFECSFEGTSVVWEGRRFDDAGSALVYIDGKEISTVDQYGPGRDLPFAWHHDGLSLGGHQMKVVATPARNAASKGRWINVTRVGAPTPPFPDLDADALKPRPSSEKSTSAQVLLDVDAEDGSTVHLRDFGTAGVDGIPYRSWLPVKNVDPVPFSKVSPLRTVR